MSEREKVIFAVGKALWFVFSYRPRKDEPPAERGREVIIARVGRKWITTTSGLRIDKQTLQADGGNFSSPGRAYVSREAYRQEVQVELAWDALMRAIRWAIPEGVRLEDIHRAAELLRVRI